MARMLPRATYLVGLCAWPIWTRMEVALGFGGGKSRPKAEHTFQICWLPLMKRRMCLHKQCLDWLAHDVAMAHGAETLLQGLPVGSRL